MRLRFLCGYLIGFVLVANLDVTLALTPAEVTNDYSGFLVGEVSVVSDSNLTKHELSPDVTLVSGEPITLDALETTRKNLLARGVFDHVTIDATARGNRLDLVFRLESVLTVRSLEIDGAPILDQQKLRSRAQIRPGERILPESLEAARSRLLELLKAEGFPAAAVSYALRATTSAPQRVVQFSIELGNPVIFTAVKCDSEIPADINNKVRVELDSLQGQRASRSLLESTIWKIVREIRREGYIQARILPPTTVSTADLSQVVLVCDFRQPVQFNFRGLEKISATELLSVLALDTRRIPFSVLALPSVAQEMEALYQSRGFFFARVDITEVEPQSGRKIFDVAVNEGSPVQLTKISFEGVRSVPERALVETMPMKPYRRGYFGGGDAGLISNALIEDSLSRIVSYYERRGYPGTTVSFGIESAEGSGVELLLSVTESEPKKLQIIQFEGAGSEEELLRDLSAELEMGQPLDLDRLDGVITKMQEALDARGYPESAIAPQFSAEDGALSFKITLTEQVRLRGIRTAGNLNTRDDVIRRELTLAPGDFVTQAKIEESIRQLYRLGLFRSVSIEAADGRFDSAAEDLLVTVGERDSLSVGGGILFNTDDGLNLTATLSQRNWRGEGESIVAAIDGFIKSGQRFLDAGRLRLGYREPYFFGEPLELSTEFYLQNSIKLINRFSYDLTGIKLNLRHNLSPEISALIGIEPYFRKTYDVPEDIILGPGDTGTTRYTVLRSQFGYDDRDDTFNPRRGVSSTLTARIATDVLGAESDFVGLRLDQNFYIPLGTGVTFANRTYCDFVTPIGDSHTVPLGERFFLGGRNSLRGFSPATIGPRGDEGDIVGGDTAVVAMSEILLDLTDELTWVTFLDIGQTVLRHPGLFDGDPLSLSFSDLRYSPGLGIRYRTPVGPLGVEYGFALNREHGEGFGVLNISIGGTF